jgi:hypothetical protein
MPNASMDATISSPERLPVIDVSRIEKLRQRIVDEPEVFQHVGSVPRGRQFEQLVQAVHDCLPRHVPFVNVYDSMISLAGRPLGDRDMYMTAWRLAANVRRLRYSAVPPWSGQASPEWVPAEVANTSFAVNHWRETGASVEFVILAGTPAGMVLTRFIARRFAGALGVRLGFGRSHQPSRFHDVAELVGLRMFLHIVPERCHEHPDWDRVAVAPAQLQFNRELLQKRLRTDPALFECPFRINPLVACYQCPVGRDRCSVAARDETLVKKYCIHCESDSWFNAKQLQRGVCEACRRKFIQKGT